MPSKPTTAVGYRQSPVQLEHVRDATSYLAASLGDLMERIVVIGGLVPSLIIDQQDLPDGVDAHLGTIDLDVGLAPDLLESGRNDQFATRLTEADMKPDLNEKGNQTRQRWIIDRGSRVPVDFITQPGRRGDRDGTLRRIASGLAALMISGLHLAFRDGQRVILPAEAGEGEQGSREIWVCGPGAFIVLKALAFELRAENKDAYDLFYMLSNHGTDPGEIVDHLGPLLDDKHARRARRLIDDHFTHMDGPGPRAVAHFMKEEPDEDIQADVAAFSRNLIERLR